MQTLPTYTVFSTHGVNDLSSEEMIDHRSYMHNLSSGVVKLKPEKIS